MKNNQYLKFEEVAKWKYNVFETYKPKIKKYKIPITILLIVTCLVTPATNWMIPFAVGWMLK